MMQRLGDRGVLFGYSATVTRDNWRMLVSDEWVDPLVARGAMVGWHFLYMPIGRDPSVAPMLTPEERNAFRDPGLADAFNSAFFREIRARQPFSHNLFRPCMLIDEPEQSREIMARTGARPTHPGAESLLTQLSADVDDYAAEVDRVYAPLWDCFVAERRARDEEGVCVH